MASVGTVQSAHIRFGLKNSHNPFVKQMHILIYPNSVQPVSSGRHRQKFLITSSPQLDISSAQLFEFTLVLTI